MRTASKEKLLNYSLKTGHPRGKAEAFARALGATADDLEYIAEALLSGVRTTPGCPAFGLRECTASIAR